MIPKDMVVHVSKVFNFSPVEIFDAWTDPDIARHWLFVGDESVLTHIDIDLRVGGKFLIVEKKESQTIDHFGKYFEINSPFHLAFSLDVPAHFTGTTYVSIFIQPRSNGCELNLTQTGVAPDKTEASWILMLHQLENVLNDALLTKQHNKREEAVAGFAFP